MKIEAAFNSFKIAGWQVNGISPNVWLYAEQAHGTYQSVRSIDRCSGMVYNLC